MRKKLSIKHYIYYFLSKIFNCLPSQVNGLLCMLNIYMMQLYMPYIARAKIAPKLYIDINFEIHMSRVKSYYY